MTTASRLPKPARQRAETARPSTRRARTRRRGTTRNPSSTARTSSPRTRTSTASPSTLTTTASRQRRPVLWSVASATPSCSQRQIPRPRGTIVFLSPSPQWPHQPLCRRTFRRPIPRSHQETLRLRPCGRSPRCRSRLASRPRDLRQTLSARQPCPCLLQR